MGACCGPNCKGNSGKGDRLFKFPSDTERRLKWISNCRWQNWTPGPNSKLCQRHFEESQFEQNRKDGWKKLKQIAIPTLFDIPDPVPRMDNKRRLLVRNPVLFPAAQPPSRDLETVEGIAHYPSGLNLFNLNNEKVELADHSYSSSSRLKVVVLTGNEEDEENEDDLTDHQRSLRPLENKKCEKCHLQYLEIRKLRRQVRNLESQIKNMESNLGTLFAADQLHFLKVKNKKMMKWSDETIKNSRMLKNVIGRRGYELLRKYSYPLPSGGSIYRHLAMQRKAGGSSMDDEIPLEEGAVELVETSFTDDEDQLALAMHQNNIIPSNGSEHPESHHNGHMQQEDNEDYVLHEEEEYTLQEEEYDLEAQTQVHEYVTNGHDENMEISHEMQDFMITEMSQEQHEAYVSGQQLVELPSGEQVMAFPDGEGGLVLENGEHVLLLEEVEETADG